MGGLRSHTGNVWFDDLIAELNNQQEGNGTRLRHLIQLLKRFCRSRQEWDLPNGMKLTMLAAECQPTFDQRIDNAFCELLRAIKDRLTWNKVIRNLAHPDKPAITKTNADDNVVELEKRIAEALDQLATLDSSDANDAKSARQVWDWIFKSDGFFAEYDEKKAQEEKRTRALVEKAALISAGARTSSTGVIGSVGVVNPAHSFHGDENLDQKQ
jgi:hypothetical protein